MLPIFNGVGDHYVHPVVSSMQLIPIVRIAFDMAAREEFAEKVTEGHSSPITSQPKLLKYLSG